MEKRGRFNVNDFARFLPLLQRLGPELENQLVREMCEDSLYDFLREAWPAFDPAPFVGGWHLEAIAEHLEAVTNGQIRKLLINVRPRSGKTGLVAVAWPCWTWALQQRPDKPLHGAGVRFLCGSYGANKAQEDGVTARRLIGSEWYQSLWGDRVKIAKDRDNQERYDTLVGGSRINTGIPESLGKGGMIRLLDDPHKTNEVESEVTRGAVIRGYKEIWSTRSNDPAAGAEVMIMQRQAENDLSGYWLETYGSELVHLCIPAWHESDRRCTTYVNGYDFWEDPREYDGQSFWPERYPPKERAVDEALGAFAFAGQIQQRPDPRGGGIIKREWWQLWPPADEVDRWVEQTEREDGSPMTIVRFPPFEFIMAYVDTAFTQKEENAYCAFVRFAVFADSAGRPKVMMAQAWRDRPTLRQLCIRILDSCRLGKVDVLVIENKAGAEWVKQEMEKLMRQGEFTIVLDDPRGDKVARLHAVAPLFEDGVVYAPDRQWADMVITEVGAFPKGRFADLTDCTSGGLGYLRRNDLIKLSVEFDEDERDSKTFGGNSTGIAGHYEVN